MNIIFLTLAYQEGGRGIYEDLVNEFLKKGHNVTIVTPIERRNNQPTNISIKDNLKILKVRTLNIQKTNFIEKGVSTLTIEFLFKKAIRKYLKNNKYDLVLYSTPPITFKKVIYYIKNRDSAKTYLLLKDIFPQNAVDLNLIRKNGFIHKYFKKKEKDLYNISDYIGCMSKANVEFLLKNNMYIDNKKVEIAPNSITPTNIIKLNEEEKVEIRNKYGLPINKKILVYGGNLGKPQGVNFLIDILKSNKNNEKIFFLICGSGTEYKFIDENIKRERLHNVKLYSYIPKNEYEKLLNVCDIGLIFLDNRFTIPNFPSRLLSYMDVSMPIIASTDINTDIGEVIENANVGYWCESGDLEKFNSIIRKYVENDVLIRKHGENSRKYLEKNYTSTNTANIILKHFN